MGCFQCNGIVPVQALKIFRFFYTIFCFFLNLPLRGVTGRMQNTAENHLPAVRLAIERLLQQPTALFIKIPAYG